MSPFRSRIMLEKVAEAELVIVKGVDQLAHGLDALAELCSVVGERAAETSPGVSAASTASAGQFAAAQRQEHAGGKYRIEKRKGVARQDQSVGGAMPRAVGIFAGHAIRSESAGPRPGAA